MSTKGQTINDRLNAAKYTLAGQALARCICKATTEELMRPKKKHLDYLAACTYESNVSMMDLANMLIERTNHSNWAVVYKALITVHHLMSYGSERFTQYLASSNYSFQLSGFLDRIVAKGYAMSTFIRRHSDYINQKALSYRTLAIDLCRKQRAEENILRTMPIERLLETLPIIQKQLDTLLDFGCTAGGLSNSIITASFTLLFHDSIRLFASYNDGIINLFEKYFDLNKKMCRESFEAYKKFLSCADRMQEFLKVAESINLERGEIPDFKKAPSSLLDALEQHLISLENNKRRDKVVIDTKLATFPSFSANTISTDFDPPQVASFAAEFETKLAFTAADNEFEKDIQSIINASAIAETALLPPAALTAPSTASSLTLDSAFGVQPPKPVDQLSNDIAFGTDVAAAAPPLSSSSDIFDIEPPGYCDGLLLEPEPTLQIRMDPSIDPHTQQQLIQIQREQAANRSRQCSNNNNNINNNNINNNAPSNFGPRRQTNNPFPSRPATNKTKQESMFEDLEQTMRQSLQKVEKA